MDIQKALNELYEEKKRLDWTISTLEARLKNVTSQNRSRRGRKNMGGDERLEVSKRMSAYWAGRRAAKRAASVAKKEDSGQQNNVTTTTSDGISGEQSPLTPNIHQEFPIQAEQPAKELAPGIDLQPDTELQTEPQGIGPQNTSPGTQHLDGTRLSA